MPRKAKPPEFDTPLVKITFPSDIENADIQTRIIYAHKQLLDERRKQYEETGNPMFIWDAISICLAHFGNPGGSKGPSMIQSGMPLPGWIHDYLLQASVDLLDTQKGKAEQVGGILGFTPPQKRGSGGRSFFTQYRDYMNRHYLLSHVLELRRSEPDLSVENACIKIVNKFPKTKMDAFTLKKHYNKSNKEKKAK